jgi:cytochrome d ubiquinol oxidase subunit I
MLSLMTVRDVHAFVPGITDLLDGGYPTGQGKAIPVREKITRGKIAIQALADYRKATKAKDSEAARLHRATLEQNFPYFGYGYIKNPTQLIPSVPLTFYAFRVMILLGGFFILLFVVVLLFRKKEKFLKHKWLQWICLLSIPLPYLAGQAGWVVAEVGRQPWAIQDLLPTGVAISKLSTASVQTTFFLFLLLFTVLLIAEIRSMTKAIKKGPKINEQ